MSKPETQSPIPELTPPKCPYCDSPLPEIGCYGWALGNFTVLANFCPSCQIALHFQVFQSPSAQPGEPGAPPSPLWKPS